MEIALRIPDGPQDGHIRLQKPEPQAQAPPQSVIQNLWVWS